MSRTRRSRLVSTRLVLAVLLLVGCTRVPSPKQAAGMRLPTDARPAEPPLDRGSIELLDETEGATLDYFLERTDEHGFTIESTRWPVGSTAASGFYLAILPVAVLRGRIDESEAYERALRTVESFWDDPDDPADLAVESVHGFFPHWFDRRTGRWNGEDCYSSIDTALFVSGLLTIRQAFPDSALARTADRLVSAVDWDWMSNGLCAVNFGWRPHDRLPAKPTARCDEPWSGFHPRSWTGYNEGLLAVLLALGSSAHPIDGHRCPAAEVWRAWTSTYLRRSFTLDGQSLSYVWDGLNPALFVFQYPHVFFDLRGKTDSAGIDYFENSRLATLHNRIASLEFAGRKRDDPPFWGLTSSECLGHPCLYDQHGPGKEDGTLAPTAAAGSFPFTPTLSLDVIRAMWAYEPWPGEWFFSPWYRLRGRFGFYDAFSLPKDWVSGSYVSIDQGAIVTMIENHRSGLVRNLFMQNDEARRALERADIRARGERAG